MLRKDQLRRCFQEGTRFLGNRGVEHKVVVVFHRLSASRRRRVPDRFLLVLQRRTARAIAPGSNEAQSLLVVNIASLTLAPTWVAFRGVLFTNSYDVTVMRWPG